MSRAQTRTLVQRLAANLPALDDQAPPALLAKKIHQRFPYLQTLVQALRHGVAYHNAALPSWARESLEDLIEQRALKVVVATTTLAEGVDLPFRVVVMAGWQQKRFDRQQPISSLLFRNIAGRCGRAGVYAEGDTIIVDNPEQPGTHPIERLRQYLHLYVNPPEISLRSALSLEAESRLASDLDINLSVESLAALESQFAAFLDAVPPDDDQEERFLSSIFASRDSRVTPIVRNVLQRFSSDMLSPEDYPIFQQNSPISLTVFGRSALATGLSGRSCLNLARFLTSYTESEEPRKGGKARKLYRVHWSPFVASLSERIIESQSFVMELESGEFKSVGRRYYPVKSKNFRDVVLAWLSGVSLPEMAALLSSKSSEKQVVDNWLLGQQAHLPNALEDDVESLAVFCGSYLAQRWSWVLRSTAVIAEACGDVEMEAKANNLALRMTYGVRHVESAHLLAEGCPADRSLLDALVGIFVSDGPQQFEPVPFRTWLSTQAPITAVSAMGIIGLAPDWDSSINAIREFLTSRE